MSRRAPAKVQNLVDAAKLVFVLSLLLAFGMRRALAESHDRFPWLGPLLLGFIVLSGGFLLASALFRRRNSGPESDETRSKDPAAGPDAPR